MKKRFAHGGRRAGAGRKAGSGPYGEPTVGVRVPKSRESIIRAWLHWLAVGTRTRLPVIHDASFLSLPLIHRVTAYLSITSEANIERDVAVDRLLFHPRPDYLLRVGDESMCDAGIFDRDLLVVHRTLDATDGQIIVARVKGQIMVKRYKHARGQIVLMSENPQFAPITVDPRSTDFRIEGVCVGVIRIRGFT